MPPVVMISVWSQEAMHAEPGATFEACSAEVADAMGPDVMKSIKHLIPDILAHIPMLLYQG
jgi:vitellogenic carboxypeptidase-like protein